MKKNNKQRIRKTINKQPFIQYLKAKFRQLTTAFYTTSQTLKNLAFWQTVKHTYHPHCYISSGLEHALVSIVLPAPKFTTSQSIHNKDTTVSFKNVSQVMSLS